MDKKQDIGIINAEVKGDTMITYFLTYLSGPIFKDGTYAIDLLLDENLNVVFATKDPISWQVLDDSGRGVATVTYGGGKKTFEVGAHMIFASYTEMHKWIAAEKKERAAAW